MNDLSVPFGGRRLATPVLTASGCGGSGRELGRFVELSRLGAFVTPSVTVAEPRLVRAPHLVETPSGILTSDAPSGPALQSFVERDLPWLEAVGATVVVSVSGAAATEFAEAAGGVRASPGFGAVAGVEVNLAGPGPAHPDVVLAHDPSAAGKVVALVREQLPRDVMLLAKLSADAANVVDVAAACVRAGADGLTTTSPLGGMAIDPQRLRPVLAGRAGLAGPAIHPLAVRSVWQLRRAMDTGRLPTVPIIGVGGVRSGADALALMAAGATAVQLGSVLLHDPQAPERVLAELRELLRSLGGPPLREVVGAAHDPDGWAGEPHRT